MATVSITTSPTSTTHPYPYCLSPVNDTEVQALHNFTNTPGEDPHAYRSPTESDSRGPCPALNALANHGYLPRNGMNITRAELLAALQNPNAYHISKLLAEVLVHGGFCLMHDHKSSCLSLHELARHGYIEHDASLVHKNAEPGNEFAPVRCDTKLLDTLLDADMLTVKRVAQRRAEMEKVTPLDKLHAELARGEWALILDIFGWEHGGEVPSDMLRVFLQKNQLPEGWKPTHEQGFFQTRSKAAAIQKLMEEFRKAPEGLEERGTEGS